MPEDTYMESPYSKASIESLFKLLHGDRKMLPPPTTEELLASANDPSGDAKPQSKTISKASHHPIDLAALKAMHGNLPSDQAESPLCPQRKETEETKNTTLQKSETPFPSLTKSKHTPSGQVPPSQLFPS